MKRSIVIFLIVLCIALIGLCWWYTAMRDVNLAEIQARTSLKGTSVSYSWTGGFSLGNCDVHAFFSGDGEATLKVGDKSIIRIPFSEEKFRRLLKCLYDNKFTEIKVKRRWGMYCCDIGRYEVAIKDGNRQMVIYADEKHYVDRADLLNPILAEIYARDKDFGQKLDYGPLGMAGIQDFSEIITASVVIAIIFISALLFIALRWIKNRKKNFKQNCLSKMSHENQ